MLAAFCIAVASLVTAVASSPSPPLLFSSWIPVGQIAPANQTSIFVQNVSAAFAISPSRVVLTAVNASYVSFYFGDSDSSSSSSSAAAAAWLTVPQYSSDALNYFLLNMTSSDRGYLMGLPGALQTNDTLRAAALVRPPALEMPAPPVSTTSPVQLQLGSQASADVVLVRNTVASCLGISSTNIRTARLEDVSGSDSGSASAVVLVTFFSSPLANASQGFSAPLSDADLTYFATVNAAPLSACVANGLNVSASSSSSDTSSTAPHLVEVLFDDDGSVMRTQLTQLLAALPPSSTVTSIEGHRAVLRVFANSTRTAAGVVQAALAAVFVAKPPPTPSSKPSAVLLGVALAVAAVIVVAIVVSAAVLLSRRRASRRRGTHMASSSSSPLPTKADVMMLEDE